MIVWESSDRGELMDKKPVLTVVMGVPVLSMHAPCEIVSKADVYMTARAYRAFYEAR